MWTPRRILFLLFGVLGFAAAYLGYARILGGMDGLPQLPGRFLTVAEPGEIPPAPPISPTEARLIEAFGANCPERNYSAYPTKIEMREDGIVFAAGRPQWGSVGERFVTLTPFSIAVFGKPPPPQHRAAGEITEISTLHADVAILEFDRPVVNEKDMLGGKAKLVGVELRSLPTPYSTDPQNGRIHITNNQRSPDPNKALLFKTAGPVFYRVADSAKPNPAAPDILTYAPVQIENRENMPRPLREPGLPAVPVAGDGTALPTEVVAQMAVGVHTPPPTVTADGMRIYLRPSAPPPPGQAPAKKHGPAFSGVRQIELLENVVFHLWADGKAGFPGSTGSDAGAESKPAPADPPLAALAVGGGLADAGVLANRLAGAALVQIRTFGPFTYDYEKNLARFEIAPRPNPLLSNHVEVTRFSALGPRDYLVCQLLELELDRPITEGGAAPAPDKPRGNAPAFKAVRATGPHVYLMSEADQLQAQGTSLIHRTGLTDPKDPKRKFTQTDMQGAPLVALRDRSKLVAGRGDEPGQAAQPGLLTMVTPESQPGSKEPPQNRATVRGPGWIEVYDAESKAVTLRAVWGESLEQVKDRVGGKDLDLLVFNGGGRLDDPKGDFDLKADLMKLWLEGAAKGGGKEKDKGGQPLPFRLQGVGHVDGRSADAIIKKTDHLNVWFHDATPPAKPQIAAGPQPAVAVAPPPAAGAKPQSGGSAGPPLAAGPKPQSGGSAGPPSGPAAKKPDSPAPAPAAAAVAPLPPDPPPAAERPKPNPFHLSAVNVEVWVSRYPADQAGKSDKQKAPAGAGALPGGGGGPVYELDRARCDGRVIVHQDPADPAKTPRGTDISGATLHVQKFPTGSLLTVIGTDQLLAEVHFESTTVCGPHVVIDQPNNLVNVTGRGTLSMPSSSDLSGAERDKPADMTVVWTEKMRFHGERRGAEFVGNVQAEQRGEQPGDKNAKPGSPEAGPTWSLSRAVCHRMEVTFDRPVYFNQLKSDRDKPAAGKKDDSPKIETVVCLPAPEDDEGDRRKGVIPPTRRAPVVFSEETFAARTGKHVKAFWLTARLLEVRTEETRSLVCASGPGETRILQMGSKDAAAGPLGAPAGGALARPAAKPGDEEMKLTVVNFRSKLRIKDQKGIFQQAVYEEAVRAIQIPTDNLALAVNEYALPPRSVTLRCSETLTVSSYKGKDGAEETRQMEAVGAAKMQDEAYIGDGHTINYDGAVVILRGYGDGQASLRRRQRTADAQDYNSGREIRYDTRTGSVTVVDSSGSRITTSK
jgi:hypothetical protein